MSKYFSQRMREMETKHNEQLDLFKREVNNCLSRLQAGGMSNEQAIMTIVEQVCPRGQDLPLQTCFRDVHLMKQAGLEQPLVMRSLLLKAELMRLATEGQGISEAINQLSRRVAAVQLVCKTLKRPLPCDGHTAEPPNKLLRVGTSEKPITGSRRKRPRVTFVTEIDELERPTKQLRTNTDLPTLHACQTSQDGTLS